MTIQGHQIVDPINHVYFVTNEVGHVKIGTSIDLLARLKFLKTANAGQLTFLGAIPGDRFTEKAIHERFENLRLQGEWFTLDDSLHSFINTLLSLYPDYEFTSRRQKDVIDHGYLSSKAITEKVTGIARLAFPLSTARQLSESTGISIRTVEHWLQGKASPSCSNLIALIDLFGPTLLEACLPRPLPRWLKNLIIRREGDET